MNSSCLFLLIGNGFDLDLKLNTRFSDYANSPFWPGIDGSKLSIYFERYKSIEKWFDMEGALLKYSLADTPYEEIANTKNEIDADLIYFQKLRNGLINYLTEEQAKQLDTDSVAAKLLKTVYNDERLRLYSLNYTDINFFCKKLGLNGKINILHIHGNLQNKNIVIGVDDSILRAPYKFLRKSRCESHNPYDIKDDLVNSKDIIFFGVSFGRIDRNYFESFFQQISDKNYSLKNCEEKKHITIITFDEDNRNSIFDFFDEINVDIDNLKKQTYFDIVLTKNGVDNDKFQKLIERIRLTKSFLFTPGGK